MKFRYHSLFLVASIGFQRCQSEKKPSQEAGNQSVTTPKKSLDSLAFQIGNPTPTDLPSKDTIPCSAKGELLDVFTQNQCKFERFKKQDSLVKRPLEWLKITLPNGTCRILSAIQANNSGYGSSEFEDFDKDGMKDRMDYGKWAYHVTLFSKKANDFSRKIEGDFNGEQWDFDRAKQLKWQYFEEKEGGRFQLYRLQDTILTVFSEIYFEGNSREPIVQIRKNIRYLDWKYLYDEVSVPKAFGESWKAEEPIGDDVWMRKTKKLVEAYWRKNLNLFVKKAI